MPTTAFKLSADERAVTRMYSDVLRLTNSAEDLARYPGWDDSKLAVTLYHLDLVAASIEAEAAAEPDLEKILGRIRRRHAKGVTR